MYLSHPPMDDDYLVIEDERRGRSCYDYAADWDEDEAVEDDFGPDPLRLAYEKSRTGATVQLA